TMGAQVPLVGPDGTEIDLTVTGVYSDAEILGPFYIGNDTYEQMIPENLRNTQMVLATAADGTSTEQLVESMTDELADIPIASVQTKQQFIDVQAGGIDQLLTVINALLGLALVIAVLGVVNTLARSVIGRRTEVGRLRGVGAQRSQLRRRMTRGC